jgi:hypothetical protein
VLSERVWELMPPLSHIAKPVHKRFGSLQSHSLGGLFLHHVIPSLPPSLTNSPLPSTVSSISVVSPTLSFSSRENSNVDTLSDRFRSWRARDANASAL